MQDTFIRVTSGYESGDSGEFYPIDSFTVILGRHLGFSWRLSEVLYSG